MTDFIKTFEVRWADMDMNGHMRHSAYNDYAAQSRVALFDAYGVALNKMVQQQLGPVLFREETLFYREIHMSQQIHVRVSIEKMRKNTTKWTICSEFFSDNKEPLAKVTVDGSWLDLKARKITVPSDELIAVFQEFPKSANFEWLPDKSRR